MLSIELWNKTRVPVKFEVSLRDTVPWATFFSRAPGPKKYYTWFNLKDCWRCSSCFDFDREEGISREALTVTSALGC